MADKIAVLNEIVRLRMSGVAQTPPLVLRSNSACFINKVSLFGINLSRSLIRALPGLQIAPCRKMLVRDNPARFSPDFLMAARGCHGI
ncbi:MAG: hypothetical protein LBK61_03935 [Spirochaetaceae bacterium]|jgi:hypothetical protein|nr:hypothetical protein [Spirochaetaceae bacterium]